MGGLFPFAEISLVIPAHFMGAGVLVVAAAMAAVLGLHRGRTPAYLAYSACCLLSAAVTVAIAGYYLSNTQSTAVEMMRWCWTVAAVQVLAFFLFVALYTEAPRPYASTAVLAAAMIGIVVANHVLPLGIRFAHIDSVSYLTMPWGESLSMLDGPMTPWLAAMRVVLVATLIWAIWRLAKTRRSSREAVFLASYFAVVLVAVVHGALIDLQLMRAIHTTGLVLVGLALLMGLNLVMRLRDDNLALAAQAAQLRAENERRRTAEESLRERAYRDPTTGLANRLFVQDKLRELLEEAPAGTHGALLILDLDHFKVVNDALTQEVGDLVLREVGRRVVGAAGERAVAARLDGDSFVVLSAEPVPSAEEASGVIEAAASRLSLDLVRPIVHEERNIILSASMGSVTFTAGEASSSEVLGRAEMALTRAKQRGPNNVQPFLASFQEEAAERFRIVEGLRHAIESGEMDLHYQPQVDREGSVVGAEALMRWNSRAMGPISPGRFIPMAEETGLIHVLGAWSLRRGCERLAAWKREGVPFAGHLSVNVSPWQLARGDFVDDLKLALEESGADPARLVLEITESAVLFDLHDTVAKLREIRALGPRIALDDFGTGYSSLALIRDLPLDMIKIDQAFVRQLAHGINPRLIRVIVAIGDELGLEVIAEGVETASDREALLALGCGQLQGYHIAHPLVETAFLEYVRAPRTVAWALTV